MHRENLPQLEQDNAQRLRIRRSVLAVAGTAVTVGIAVVAAGVGYLPYRAAAIYSAMVGVLCAGFYTVLRAGLNLRFADPSLTMAQLFAAGIAVSYLVFEGGNARPAFLAMYLLAYMFGAFTLDTRGLVLVALFYLACYIGVFALSLLIRPGSVEIHRELFRIAVFAGVMGWMSYLGSYVTGLRRHLRSTTDELKQALALADVLANYDSLTNCFNRRRMQQVLDLEHKRAKRGSPLSVCAVDIDHFKSVNDNYGHLAGDRVLKQLAAVIRGQLRETDSLARYGGEEFLVALPQTALAGAVIFAERVRRTVEAEAFSVLPAERRMTISVGVAQHRPADDIDRTLSRADVALYEAKRQGRNRAVCSS